MLRARRSDFDQYGGFRLRVIGSQRLAAEALSDFYVPTVSSGVVPKRVGDQATRSKLGLLRDSLRLSFVLLKLESVSFREETHSACILTSFFASTTHHSAVPLGHGSSVCVRQSRVTRLRKNIILPSTIYCSFHLLCHQTNRRDMQGRLSCPIAHG